MSFWDKAKAAANSAMNTVAAATSEASTHLSNEVSKYKNKEFLVAIITANVWVASSDGTISASERSTLSNFLSISEELKVFGASPIISEFEKASDLFKAGPELGSTEALKRIRKIKGDEGASRTLVRVCISLAKSDGDFSKAERDVIVLIATELGLNPAEFLPA